MVSPWAKQPGAWVLLLGILASTAASAQTLQDPNLIAEPVITGFNLPNQIEFLGPDDLFLLEQKTGKVFRVTAGVIAGQVLDVAVNLNGGEHGLLGIALHPQFAVNGWVYLYYSESSTGADTAVAEEILGNRIYRYTFDGSVLHSPTLIKHLPGDPGASHNGGILRFGPDDKLYAVIGDQVRQGVLQNTATGGLPDDTGVILRLEDDGSPAAGNPFLAVTGYESYYAYGLRNCYGLAFDPLTGALWQTENGPTNYDEINRVDPGLNSGWNKIMGPDARDPHDVSDLVMVAGASYSDPEFSWFFSRGVTAIEFFASAALGADYENDVFTADIVYGNLHRFELDGARAAFTFASAWLQDLVADDDVEMDEVLFGSFAGITDLKTGPDGNLYVLTRTPGTLYRVRHVLRDLATANADLGVVCTGLQTAAVTGTYRVFGDTGVVIPSAQVDFYVDDVLPGNLVQSYVDTDLADGAEVTHAFEAMLPTANPHTVIMVLDGTDLVAEDRETNNRAERSVQCALVSTPPAPAGFGVTLHPSVPNPFDAGTSIRYTLGRPGRVEVDVLDARGRCVARLLSEEQPEGPHTIAWNGRDAAGRPVAAGVYRVRVTMGEEMRSRAIVLGH